MQGKNGDSERMNLWTQWCKERVGQMEKMALIYIYTAVAAAKSLQSCLTLCDPTDGSLPGSPVPGILQARVLEWVSTAFSNIYTLLLLLLLSLFSRVRLCATPQMAAHQAPLVPGILQARTLEWVAISFSNA